MYAAIKGHASRTIIHFISGWKDLC